jgi:hydroxymethylpyrimidine/phosphomethylpyrimidine kinase / thiaminase
MVSTSGSTLLPQTATKAYLTDLLPCTTILTPNLPEALLLAKLSGKNFGAVSDLTEEKRLELAFYMASKVEWLLLKGGHAPIERDGKKIVVDILVHGKESQEFISDFSLSKNTHGTGCTLACIPLHLRADNSCNSCKYCSG